MTDPQRLFWMSQKKFRLFVGGVGSGKTRAGIIEAFRQPPKSNGMIVAPTYKMLEDATLRTFLELAREAKILVSYKQDKRIAELHGGRTITFRSGEDPDTLRGPNLGWFMLDEAAMLDEIVWLIMVGRIRELPSKGWAVTTPRGKNWLYKRFTSGSDYDIIKSSTRDNPFLPDGYVETLQDAYSREWQAQEIDGEFLDPEGAMFKRDWFRIVHSTPSNLQWVRYWDLAASTRTTADFTASISAAMDDNGILYLRDGIHIKAEWPDVQKTIVRTMLSDSSTYHYIEEALHGLAAVQELMRIPDIAHISFSGMRPVGDKVQRAMAWSGRAESGKVHIVAGDWIHGFLDEITQFPFGKHDDWVDAVSGTLPVLGGGGKLLLWE